MKAVRISQAAFATLPPLMQLVQTFIRRTPPPGNCTRIDCRLGLKTRVSDCWHVRHYYQLWAFAAKFTTLSHDY